MGRVEAICTAGQKGTPKKPVASARFVADHGIEGDAHAGPWHRQVSLLSADDIAEARHRLPDIAPGDFAENVIVSGIEIGRLGLGSVLRLGGSAELTITQIGKVCHDPCRIQAAMGECIMPARGLFARVIAGGDVRPGDSAEVLSLVPREVFQVVVLTISDRCSRGEATDTAGPATAELARAGLPAHVYRVEVIPDEQDRIAGRLAHYCDGHTIDLVLTVGGTGFSPRDVTPEATRSVVHRLAPGLDEAMRAASMLKTPHAMLSRGVCGIRGRTLIVNLPGSRRAAVENLQAILPALPHGLGKLRGDAGDCGRDQT